MVLQCRLGYPSDVVEASYRQLLSYMGRVSKNEAQEAIDFVIDAVRRWKTPKRILSETSSVSYHVEPKILSSSVVPDHRE